ncbi:pilus assembly protein TadG-related protein [Microlunatus parietis]|uniref:Putative Flp pilus-assembly TadG-like N-terminal domain-containing protein n=1 Tax=Microlunatus parietis TaxID=682979 RepID=A0A7Y9I8U4_9ACTN|nr:hypothetical protein [Microlunatus parietis]NYE72322.1 hypothetical protein [Microlunatus parietis]
MSRAPELDQRGQSVSVYAIVVLAALIAATGLVVDGGQQIAAASRAEAVAAEAARAAGNAAASQRLAGYGQATAAVRAARTYLAGQPDVAGEVRLSGGIVRVSTVTRQPTLFLGVIGIREVIAQGSAEARLVPTGADG